MSIDETFELGPLLQTAFVGDSDDARDFEETDEKVADVHGCDGVTALSNDSNDVQPQLASPDTTAASLPHSTLPVQPPSNDCDEPTSAMEGTAELQKPAQQKAHGRRKRKRAENADGQGHEPRKKTKVKILAETAPVPTALVTEELRVACGAYEAFRKEIIRGLKVVVSPAKGLGMGIQYIPIDPTSTK